MEIAARASPTAIETALADATVSQRLVEQRLVPARAFTPKKSRKRLAEEWVYRAPIVRATGTRAD